MREVVLSKRNMGLEVLKIFSTFMVVVLHCLGAGGILTATQPLSANYNISWLLEVFCYGAVNIFAITTGYVSIHSRHRLNRLFDLWGGVLFYDATVALIFLCFGKIGFVDFIFNSLPLTNNNHWYFSSFVCLWIFIPYINKLLLSITKKQHLTLILIFFSAFSLYYLVYKTIGKDIFVTKDGYSPVWLLILYIIGAFLSLYKQELSKFKKSVCLGCFIFCNILAWSAKLVLMRFDWSIATNLSDVVVSYQSPLIVLSSVSIVMLFSQIQVNRCNKLTSVVSASSFYVYIIHTIPLIWRSVLSESLAPLAEKPWYVLIFGVLGVAVAIYIVCTVIDILRRKLFALVRIHKLYDIAIKFLYKIFSSVRNYILNKI